MLEEDGRRLLQDGILQNLQASLSWKGPFRDCPLKRGKTSNKMNSKRCFFRRLTWLFLPVDFFPIVLVDARFVVVICKRSLQIMCHNVLFLTLQIANCCPHIFSHRRTSVVFFVASLSRVGGAGGRLGYGGLVCWWVLVELVVCSQGKVVVLVVSHGGRGLRGHRFRHRVDLAQTDRIRLRFWRWLSQVFLGDPSWGLKIVLAL